MPHYVLGDTEPDTTPDIGAGAWCSMPSTWAYAAYKRALQYSLDTRSVQLTVGMDAVNNMRHYLANTGSDMQIDVDLLFRRSDYMRLVFDRELEKAKGFIETLPPGRHQVTSSTIDFGQFTQRVERDLYFAIGGFRFWGMGNVLIASLPHVTRRQFALDFTFHFIDRYNWDKGKATKIEGPNVTIRDETLQELHRRCFAREFDIKGVASRRIEWVAEPRSVDIPNIRNPFDVLLKK